MFIDIGHPHLVNLDHVKEIVRMKAGAGPREEIEVVFTDGTVKRFAYAWDSLRQRLMGAIVAAPPGWQVAYAIYEGSGKTGPLTRIDLCPVIAFSVDGRSMVTPIGLEILPANKKALVAPDGRVFDGWETRSVDVYASLDEWRAYLEAEARKTA